MSRPRGRRSLRSVQGFILRHVSTAEYNAIKNDPFSGFTEVGDSLTANDYQKPRDSSPTSITATDMQINAGLFGDPLPTDKRRDGYADPVEQTRDKLSAWKEIGEVLIDVVQVTQVEFENIETDFSVTKDGKVLDHTIYSNFS